MGNKEGIREALARARSPSRRAALERQLALLGGGPSPSAGAEALRRHLDSLLAEMVEWIGGWRPAGAKGTVGEMRDWLLAHEGDPRHGERLAAYGRAFDEAQAAWPGAAEFGRLCCEYGIEAGGPESNCWECHIEAGRLEWTHQDMRRFRRERPGARLCFRHAMPIMAARGKLVGEGAP